MSLRVNAMGEAILYLIDIIALATFTVANSQGQRRMYFQSPRGRKSKIYFKNSPKCVSTLTILKQSYLLRREYV